MLENIQDLESYYLPRASGIYKGCRTSRSYTSAQYLPFPRPIKQTWPHLAPEFKGGANGGVSIDYAVANGRVG